MEPILSDHFKTRTPSAIRVTQIEFLKRSDGVHGINTAIGNVTLPMHPAMTKRMFHLSQKFQDGVVKYSPTVGEKEINDTFLHLIETSGFSTEGLHTQVTEGGSQAMELVILGVGGPPGSGKQPVLLLDPIYSNYASIAERIGRSIVTVPRHLEENGKFTLPDLSEIERVIQAKKPGALLAIPYDNPTGQFFPQKTLVALAKLCVKHNLWFISDEAYRELFYTKDHASSIWGVTEKEVPGITGRRISIESASKAWNACGLRIGGIVTDNKHFHHQAIAENTANLSPNVIGQYIFGALLHESKKDLNAWFAQERAYYHEMSQKLTTELKREVPDLIVSLPEAALYTVVDLRKIGINAMEFAMYCAQKGNVDGKTLLLAPMEGFYSTQPNPGKSQLRIAYVEEREKMAEIPKLFKALLKSFDSCRP